MKDLSILAASFWENWNYAKELSRIKSPKAADQLKAAQQIRAEWQEEQRKQNKLKTNEKTLRGTVVDDNFTSDG